MGTTAANPTLPETGFVRLCNIIGDAKADPPHFSHHPGIQEHLVGRGQIRPLPEAGQTWSQNHCLESIRHQGADRRDAGM